MSDDKQLSDMQPIIYEPKKEAKRIKIYIPYTL